MWTDSHCHLQDESDVAGVLAQAAEADVVRMVCIGTDLDQSRRALALALASSAEANPVGSGSGLGRRSEGEAPAPGPVRVWASVGLHPHRAGDDLAPLVRYLQDLSEPDRRRVVAIGECGLDYHYEFSPRPAQREAFARQVALAREHGLALVIHTREAWDDTFAVLESEGVPERTVFHCFTGGTEEAR
ncbi:MAG: TatD family hydrolase, partial [Acidimicrobiales bacterium]